MVGVTKRLSPPLTPTGPRLTYAIIDRQGNRGGGWVPYDSTALPLPDTIARYASGQLWQPLVLAGHRSGHGYWLLNLRPSGDMAAYRIDSTGISRTPVVSRIGSPLVRSTFSYVGYHLFLSLNHRRIVLWGNYRIQSRFLTNIVGLDFDDATGQVTAPRLLGQTDFMAAPGRVPSAGDYLENLMALAPQGRYAYVFINKDSIPGIFNQLLYQYDLLAGTPAAVAASARVVARQPGINGWRQIINGPDGRLYLTFNLRNVDVVDCPDKPGSACSFRRNGVVLPKRTYGSTPGAVQNEYRYPTPYADIFPVLRLSGLTVRGAGCVGQAAAFVLTQATGLDSARWRFGDGTTATGFTVRHAYAQPGVYAVTGIYFYRCSQDTVRATIRVLAAPALPPLPDTSACAGQPVRFALPLLAGIDSVRWAFGDGATTAGFSVRHPYAQSGTYTATATAYTSCGAATGRRIVVVGAVPAALLLPDTSGCAGQPVRFALPPGVVADSVHWAFGDGTTGTGGAAAGSPVAHSYGLAGTYAATGTYYQRCGAGTVRRRVRVGSPPAAALLLPPLPGTCEQPTTLRVRAPAGVAWQWADGAPADSVRRVTAAGTYALTWQAGPCQGREQATVAAPAPCPPPLLLPDIITPGTADGRNDTFRVDAPGPWALTVYSRWGREVWQSTGSGYANEWAGQGLPAGTYYYLLRPLPGNPQAAGGARKGWVEVVR